MKGCPSCGPNAVVEHIPAMGSSICRSCGQVLEENVCVSEVGFVENSNGSSQIVGVFVSESGRAMSKSLNKSFNKVESREARVANGRRHIQLLANGLRLQERYIEAAQRYYNLAINLNFIQGRRIQYVACACLYIVCRFEKTSHMLIDFCDLLQTNVFVLGNTFLRLIRALNLKLPIVDPSLYISRFAALLDFGPKTHAVAQDASLLAQRMNRDWIHVGRKPSGISGACILIASRIHGFNRSMDEIIYVAKICQTTLSKRLAEFRKTACGDLTVEEFRVDTESASADPPCFKRLLNNQNAQLPKDQSDLFPSLGLSAKEKDENKIDVKKVEIKEVEEDQKESQVPTLENIIEIEDPEDSEIRQEVSSFLEESKIIADSVSLSQKEIDTSLEDGLSDAEDEEVRACILNDDEVELKTKIWNELNREYLLQLKEKRRLEIIKLQHGVQQVSKRKKRTRKEALPPPSNAKEAALQVLDKKRALSRKINYKALDSLLGEKDPAEKKESELIVPQIVHTPGITAEDYDESSISGSKRRHRSGSGSSVASRSSVNSRCSTMSRLSQKFGTPTTPKANGSQNQSSSGSPFELNKRDRLNKYFGDTCAVKFNKRHIIPVEDEFLDQVSRKLDHVFPTPPSSMPASEIHTPQGIKHEHDDHLEEVVDMVDDGHNDTFHDDDEEIEEDEYEDGNTAEPFASARDILGYGQEEEEYDGWEEI